MPLPLPPLFHFLLLKLTGMNLAAQVLLFLNGPRRQGWRFLTYLPATIKTPAPNRLLQRIFLDVLVIKEDGLVIKADVPQRTTGTMEDPGLQVAVEAAVTPICET